MRSKPFRPLVPLFLLPLVVFLAACGSDTPAPPASSLLVGAI